MSSSVELSSLIIGIIVISAVAGIGLLGLLYLLVRRNNKKHEDLELSSSISATKKKRVFSLPSTTNNGERKDIPVTSSLDTHDVFFTILEYPPTKPPTCIPNNRLLEVPTSHNNNTTCSSFSVYEDRKLLTSSNDPISVSLARQSIEERSGYYKSPARTPVPYYHQSSLTSANSNLIIIDDNDEDEKAMQRWSTSSYHVW